MNIHPLPIKAPVWVSGEASPTFGHVNANFSVFVGRIRNQFSKEMNNDDDLKLHLHETKCRAGFASSLGPADGILPPIFAYVKRLPFPLTKKNPNIINKILTNLCDYRVVTKTS